MAALAVAHMFDFSSFLVMTSRHGLEAELNPIVVTLAQDFGLPGLTIAKIGSVVLLATVVFLLREKYRKVATMVLVIGIVAGVAGGLSNIAST